MKRRTLKSYLSHVTVAFILSLSGFGNADDFGSPTVNSGGATTSVDVQKGEPGVVVIEGNTSTVDTTNGLTDVENPSPDNSTQIRDCRRLSTPNEVRECEVRIKAEQRKRVRRNTDRG